MSLFERDALLGSIDEVLAALRATLAAAMDAEQTREARILLARRAAAELAVLPDAPEPGTEAPPPAVFDAIGRAKDHARDGDVEAAHDQLARARDLLASAPG